MRSREHVAGQAISGDFPAVNYSFLTDKKAWLSKEELTMTGYAFSAKWPLPFLVLCLLLTCCTEDIPESFTSDDVRRMLREPPRNGDGGNSDDIIIEPWPDFAMIAFVSEVNFVPRIHLVNPDDREQRPLTGDLMTSAGYAPFWSPDGRVAFLSVVDDTVQVMNVDGTRNTGLVIDNLWDMFFEEAHFSWSWNGRITFALEDISTGTSDIYMINDDGTDLRKVDGTPIWSYCFHPSWSPDGTEIAFASADEDGDCYIYVVNVDSADIEQLTFTGYDLQPSWSPDGRKIAFQSDRDADYEIYVMNADGTNQINVTNNRADDELPSWSPDGNKIAFQSDRDDDYEIYVMNADGTGQVNLTNNHGADDVMPSWSPWTHGSWITIDTPVMPARVR